MRPDEMDRAPVRPWSSTWAGYAAAAWAIVFAIRGIYWALGGTVGLGTLSEGIQQAAAEGDPDLYAALWATVVLEVVAAALALALVKPRMWTLPHRLPVVGGKRVPNWALLVPAWGAGTLLAGHGSVFVSFGVLAAIGAIESTSEVRWYSLFWGPWFMLGGVLFMWAARHYLRNLPERRIGILASALGALGGLTAAGAPYAVAALA